MRAQFEAIWLDNKCRSPLGPVWWTHEDRQDHATREIAGLYSTPTKYLEDESNVEDN
jgi:hypothetical protein